MHAVLGGLFLSLEFREFPVHTAVGTDFHARNFASSTRVSVARYGIFLVDITRNGECFVVVRCTNNGIDVQFIKNVFRLVPPIVGERFFGRHVRWQDAIVVIMKVIAGFVIEHRNVRQPLDHASTNVAGYNETHRKAVIGLEAFSVGFVRHNNIIGGIHGTREWHRGTVLDRFAPGFFRKRSGTDLVGQVFGSHKFHVLASHVLGRNSGLDQQIS
mmetsp:Transcript_8401/g.12948  ORF Transcript_8401/g.12948 Transcript_8401/m.12948 type:complete len:215 (-) Transcript_8401:673-1317(-)